MKRSKYNKYYKELMEDEAMLWLKEHDKEVYSNRQANKGLEYPYLTKRKELIRQTKEVAFSNLYKSDIMKCKNYMDELEYEN